MSQPKSHCFLHSSLVKWQERYLDKLGFFRVDDEIYSIKYETWQYQFFWLDSGTLIIRLLDSRGIRHLIIIPLFFRPMKIYSFKPDPNEPMPTSNSGWLSDIVRATITSTKDFSDLSFSLPFAVSTP